MQKTRDIGLLSKIKHEPKHLLKTIYYSIFNSHLIYACEILGQEKNSRFSKNFIKVQEKVLRITNFKNFNENANPLFKENQILKISDFIDYKNALFVRKSLKKENLSLFDDMFTVLKTNQDYITRAGSKSILDTPTSQTTHYGENSISATATSCWNLLQRILNVDLLTCELHEFKKTICDSFYGDYQ